MRYILLFTILMLCVPALAVDDPERFAAYKARLRDRKVYALRTRAEIRSYQGSASRWTARRVPYNAMHPMRVGLLNGFVRQPPIPYYRRSIYSRRFAVLVY